MKILNKYFDDLKAWPFIEAIKIIKRFGGLSNFNLSSKDYINFETGYGPSGLPHIGTFGEIVRTLMVQNALHSLVDCKSKFITFSDDMDGLRKIPDNVPNKEMLKKYLGKPLTSIPDPFEKYESFAHHNNAKLCSFLNQFELKYEFISSTHQYQNGVFDEILKLILNNYDKINSVIVPTLRSERKKTYSPFLPISPITGDILQVKIEEYRPKSNSIIFIEPSNNKLTEILVTGGNCKLQWKVDWAMRWMSFGIDYEMCGKDLTESFQISSKICHLLNKKSPVNLIYEMFLDENGEKISKSVGNGISIDQWLRYGTPESLSLFMFQKPRSAKKLFFDVIPKNIDDYISFLLKYQSKDEAEKFNNPVWHIHSGSPPKAETEISFNTLINLVCACNSQDSKVLWGFLKEYDKKLDPKINKTLDQLIGCAINYYVDFILPIKKYKKIDNNNKNIFIDLHNLLKNIEKKSTSEDIQTKIYEIGKKYDFSNLRDFFKLIYQVLLGQEQGPRLGSFIKLYGIEKTSELIKKALNEQNLNN